MMKNNPFAGVLPFRHGSSVPLVGGTVSLASALAAVDRAEAVLENARAAARGVAKREGVSTRGLFEDSKYILRASGERWADTARNEGWRAGHNFLSDALDRANRPPDPADPFYHLAMRLQREGNRSLDEVRRYWDRLDAAGFTEATRAGDYEKAAQICVAVQREEQTGKVTSERILKAAKDRRMGGPPVPLPPKESLASQIIAAGKKARRPTGSDDE